MRANGPTSTPLPMRTPSMVAGLGPAPKVEPPRRYEMIFCCCVAVVANSEALAALTADEVASFDAISVAILLLRVVVGLTMAAHGYNKAFGAGGIEGTAGWFGSMGMRPNGKVHAVAAATTEISSTRSWPTTTPGSPSGPRNSAAVW